MKVGQLRRMLEEFEDSAEVFVDSNDVDLTSYVVSDLHDDEDGTQCIIVLEEAK